MNFLKEVKYKMSNKIEIFLLLFLPYKRNYLVKKLEQIAFNTRPKIEEHMLVVMDKSTHEEHLSQPLQTNNKRFKTAVTFLTGFNGFFNATDENNEFYFTKLISDDFIK